MTRTASGIACTHARSLCDSGDLRLSPSLLAYVVVECLGIRLLLPLKV